MTGCNPATGYLARMPTKNSVKSYLPNSFYHVYNRGVEKRDIFLDQQDYHVFLNLLKLYLSPQKEAADQMKTIFPGKRIRVRKTFFGDVSIHSFCLMPNHFHLLLHQQSSNGMTEFVRSVCTSYSMYFNKKYKRVGSLFQGVYKAILVLQDEYLLHLSRYIHRNPLKLTGWNPVNLESYPYSSLSTYLNHTQRPWISTKTMFDYFESSNSPTLAYREFVQMLDEDTSELLSLIIEDE